MLITCCLLAADGVLQISGKRKSASGRPRVSDTYAASICVGRRISPWELKLREQLGTRSIQLYIIPLPYIVLNMPIYIVFGGSDTPYPTVPTAVPRYVPYTLHNESRALGKERDLR